MRVTVFMDADDLISEIRVSDGEFAGSYVIDDIESAEYKNDETVLTFRVLESTVLPTT